MKHRAWKKDFHYPTCLLLIQSDTHIAKCLCSETKLVRARDEDRNTPLHEAARNGHTDVIRILIQNDARVNERGQFDQTALHCACQEGQLSCIQELMTHGAQIEAKTTVTGVTALHLAAIYHPDSVKILIENYNAEVNARSLCGDTPLHVAIYGDNVSVIAVLASYKDCDVNARNNIDRTALHLACQHRHVACIHELMKHGAELEAGDDIGSTPLHLSVTSNHAEGVKVLIDTYGASINAANKRGDTPLHLAAAAGYTDMVELLTSYPRCEFKAKNKSIVSTVQAAEQAGHTAIAEYLTSLRDDSGRSIFFIRSE